MGKVSRHCHIDMRLELEEAANCTLRAVSYELCSAVCHYGEVPESGSYKALVRNCGNALNCAPKCSVHPSVPTTAPTSGSSSPANGDWYVFDDTAVRLKSAEELGSVIQCEGYHTCFLMYRREDTKTINMRPHAI